MKNYRKPDGSIFAFELDGSQDSFITADMTFISTSDLAILRTPTLPVAKATKLAQLETSRDAATLTNVTAHGRQWQADERSQRLLSSAIILALAGAPLPAVWRDATNNDLTITAIGQLVTIAAAMAVQTQTAYTKSWTKKAQADAALNPADVSLVVW